MAQVESVLGTVYLQVLRGVHPCAFEWSIERLRLCTVELGDRRSNDRVDNTGRPSAWPSCRGGPRLKTSGPLSASSRACKHLRSRAKLNAYGPPLNDRKAPPYRTSRRFRFRQLQVTLGEEGARSRRDRLLPSRDPQLAASFLDTMLSTAASS